jgi:hypothetical protein
MKTNMKNGLIALMTVIGIHAYAQAPTSSTNKTKKSITVLNIDAKGIGLEPIQLGNLVRTELEKLDTFQVMDRYDVTYVVDKNKLSIDNCYGKICLTEIGEMIKSDKMFTGTAELYGDVIVMTLRIIDVKTASIEKTQVLEFLNLPQDIQMITRIAIQKIMNREVNEDLLKAYTKRNNYENAINNANKNTVDLDGPRTGFVMITGEGMKRIQAKKSEGGYDAFPVMFLFGYQFEKQYLSSGDWQALFEFVPAVSGFNENIFIPSLSVMNGFRYNKWGVEIALGPTFNVSKTAKGYYDANGAWKLERDFAGDPSEKPKDMFYRQDSRGNYSLQTQFIVAFGKTFRSGRLNLPVNLYVVPDKKATRVGLTLGFNVKSN